MSCPAWAVAVAVLATLWVIGQMAPCSERIDGPGACPDIERPSGEDAERSEPPGPGVPPLEGAGDGAPAPAQPEPGSVTADAEEPRPAPAGPASGTAPGEPGETPRAAAIPRGDWRSARGADELETAIAEQLEAELRPDPEPPTSTPRPRPTREPEASFEPGGDPFRELLAWLRRQAWVR